MATAAVQKATSQVKRKFFNRGGKIDTPFLILLLILLGIGLACMFSASYAYAYYWNDGDSYFYIKKQLIFAAIGIAAMIGFSLVDYNVWGRWALPIMGVSAALLVVVLLIPASDGVQRWISIPGVGQFQPSELAKFALIVLFAKLISLNYGKMKKFTTGYLPFIAILGVICALIILEPHLSGTILVFAIGLIMMYIGGTKVIYLVLTLFAGGGAAATMILVLGYERDRVNVWLNLLSAYETNRDEAWQTMQSMYAIGSGGLLGQGFTNSREKYLFLPEPQNDFIFSIVCEELGFVGAVIIIVLFALLVWRGFTIAMHAPDKFGFMLAIGLTVQIAVQVAINIAVVTNLLPNTGISLPFFSYGGTSLVMLLAQMGILLSISRHSKSTKLKE